jgi:hypothetical protein
MEDAAMMPFQVSADAAAIHYYTQILRLMLMPALILLLLRRDIAADG